MLKKWIQLILLGVISLVLVACGESEAEETSSAAGKEKEAVVVNIANLGFSTLNVAKDKGFLEEELSKVNAKFEFSIQQTGPTVNEGIASKRIDFSVLGEGAILGGANNNLDTKLVSVSTEGYTGFNTVLATKASAIETVQDLKGKKVAVTFGTAQHVFLLKLLEQEGLSADDLTLINLTIPDAHPAFQTNQIDAWVTVDSYAIIEAPNGAVTVTDGEKSKISSPTFYVARGEFAKAHPEVIEAILKAIDRTLTFSNENYEEYLEVAAKAVDYDLQQFKIFENYTFVNEVPSKSLIQELQASSDILKDLKYVTKDIDIAALIDATYINNIK